jgi:hypothetical protein
MLNECIITGIVVIDPITKTAYNGDLFAFGHSLIANCNEQSGHAADSNDPNLKWVTFDADHYFERKRVYVAHLADCTLSDAAVEYIGRHP